MRGNILGLLAVALMFVCGVAKSTPIVYNVDFTDGTETLTGTITIDGNTGALVAGDITVWDFTATGPVPGTASSSDIGAIDGCGLGCGITATAGSLAYDFSDPSDRLFFIINTSVGGLDIAFGYLGVLTVEPCCAGERTISHTIPEVGTLTIATATAPEPATVTLLGVALAGLGFARKRSRGRQSTAV